MNGPLDDAAALCNPRRLFQPGAFGGGLAQNRRPGRRHRLRSAVRERKRPPPMRLEVLRSSAPCASARRFRAPVCSAPEAEIPAHLRHAQRRDRHGSGQRAQGRGLRHAIWPRSHRGPDHGPDPGTHPRHRPRERAHAFGRAVAELRRDRDRGAHAGRGRASASSAAGSPRSPRPLA